MLSAMGREQAQINNSPKPHLEAVCELTLSSPRAEKRESFPILNTPLQRHPTIFVNVVKNFWEGTSTQTTNQR